MSPKDGLWSLCIWGAGRSEGTGLDFCEATQGLDPVWLHSVAHGEQALASAASACLLRSIWGAHRGSFGASVLAALTGFRGGGWAALKLAWKLLAFWQLLYFVTWV